MIRKNLVQLDSSIRGGTNSHHNTIWVGQTENNLEQCGSNVCHKAAVLAFRYIHV